MPRKAFRPKPIFHDFGYKTISKNCARRLAAQRTAAALKSRRPPRSRQAHQASAYVYNSKGHQTDHTYPGKFAGPCAQGVLDPIIVPRPMSMGRPGLFVLIKDNAFLRTSAHESVFPAGYLPVPCRIIVVGRTPAKR